MISHEYQKKICDLYNISDLLAFNYLLDINICNKVQKKELEDLLVLNYQLCSEPGYLTNEEEYHTRKRRLLSEFGISFTNGDAIIK